MRKITFLITAILCGFILRAQNVNIPDANFKAYLVANTEINTNGDDEIQVSEAESFTGTINVSNQGGITSLTGIEAFTSLTELYCMDLTLTTLDVSNNTALKFLLCNGNQLTDLDVSNNPDLIWLWCYDNQLTSLNVGNNTSLTQLWCYNNQITKIKNLGNNTSSLTQLRCSDNQLTSLNVSNNIALTELRCDGNQLTELDVSFNTALTFLRCKNNQLTQLNVANGNNANFISFDARGNSNLSCIEVDDASYSSANWVNIDEGVIFSEDCNYLSTGIEVEKQAIIGFCPNPASNRLKVTLQHPAIVRVVNIFGGVLSTKKLNKGDNMIDISHLESGVYYIQTANSKAAKFVKY